jgi:hypothetical protein
VLQISGVLEDVKQNHRIFLPTLGHLISSFRCSQTYSLKFQTYGLADATYVQYQFPNEESFAAENKNCRFEYTYHLKVPLKRERHAQSPQI